MIPFRVTVEKSWAWSMLGGKGARRFFRGLGEGNFSSWPWGGGKEMRSRDLNNHN